MDGSHGLGTHQAGSTGVVSATPVGTSCASDVVVNIPPAVTESNRRKVTNEIEAICLVEIEKEPKLKLILADWESKYKESKSRIDRKESLSLSVKNEIYNLIGFFSAFQGLVLTTVSQASALTCHNWWAPFALSLLCSIATLFGVCHKFYNFFNWKRAADKEIQNTKVEFCSPLELPSVSRVRSLFFELSVQASCGVF